MNRALYRDRKVSAHDARPQQPGLEMSGVAASETEENNPLENLLNYDFCPWANRWVYWLKHPLVGLTVGVFAAGLCAVYVSAQAWLLCLGMLSVITIGLLWPLISMWTLGAEIRFGRVRCEEGEAVSIEILVKNRLPVPNWGISITEGEVDNATLTSFVCVPGWQTTRFDWEFKPPKRGLYPKTRLYLQTGFPFGVWQARRQISAEGEILVTPKPIPLDCIPDLKSQLAYDDQFSPHHAGDSGDVIGTRPYRMGDSLRRIHWGLTARSGHLICTERQATVQSTQSVYLDLSRNSHSETDGNSSYEWAIRVFAGVCQAFSQRGVTVRVRFGEEEHVVTPGQQSMQQLLKILARLPELTEQTEQYHRSRQQADVAIVTDLSQPVSAAIELQLETTGFQAAVRAPTRSAALPVSGGQVVRLVATDEFATDLKTGWRRACHAIS